MVTKDCGSGFEPPRAAATASTWESNVGEQLFTEKAISLQVYAQSSCWGTATDHPCQTNSTQKVMGPGLALLTPSFSWEKRPESKAEPPDERQIESETEVSAFTPGLLPPYQNPGHSPEGPGPLGLTSPLFMATGSEFPESCAPWMLRLALLGSP